MEERGETAGISRGALFHPSVGRRGRGVTAGSMAVVVVRGEMSFHLNHAQFSLCCRILFT